MSRSGSHAGRGFRYQDAVGVWLLVKSWAGELPYGEVIPEGLDDYEVRYKEQFSLIQVKSRRNHLGSFSVAEVAGFIRALWDRVDKSINTPKSLVLLLERPVTGGATVDYLLDAHAGLTAALNNDPRWVALSPITQVCIAPSPSESALEIMVQAMSCAPLAAQVYCSELLNKIGLLADNNGLVKDQRFKGLTVSDLEETIRLLEPLLDLSGMEDALLNGYCIAIDFLTPFNDPSFYQGVDARPGHLAAGLILERPVARSLVLSALESHGSALIVGASGNGKSALMWEAASFARHGVRWFEVKQGRSEDTHLFVRLAQSLRASSSAPIGFVFDDVGRELSPLWNSLIRDVTPGSGVLLLGSIREEDMFLLTSRARSAEIRPEGDCTVAERIWTQLNSQGNTSWAGWREPWALSNGLLLEYTHILTRGDRLEAVLGEQVMRRLREKRDEELAIIRVAALVGSAGAVLDTTNLASRLNIAHGDLARALRRLIDEHLISEPVAGKIKGLHQIRSSLLFKLSHIYPPPMKSQTVTEAIDLVTSESLRALIVHVALNHLSDADALVKHIARRIQSDHTAATVISAFTALGQVHIEMTLREWLPKTISLGLEPTQVTLAVLFSVAGTDLSTLPLPEPLKGAVYALRASSVDDPRLSLMSILSENTAHAFITNMDTAQLRALMATFVGVTIPEHFRCALKKVRPCFDKVYLTGAADLLSAVRLIDLQTAIDWTKGEVLQRLLDRVPSEIPWAAPVKVDIGPEGRILRSSIFHVVDSIQEDVHQEVVQICQVLFGLDPMVEIVAVDAVAVDGLPSSIDGFSVATKRITRENSPPSVLPEWNNRWVEAAARLVGTESYSIYLQRSKDLMLELAPVLERIIDITLRCKVPPATVLEKFGKVHDATRLLAPPRDALPGSKQTEQFSTPIQHVLFNCSAELIRRFTLLPDSYGAFVLWTGDLLKKLDEAKQEPWELIGKPPDKLFQRFQFIIDSLRLFAAESGVLDNNPVHLWSAKARTAGLNNALRVVRFSADEMLRIRSVNYVKTVKNDLKEAGVDAEIYVRPNWENPLPWPALELLAIISVSSLADWQAWLMEQSGHLRVVAGENRRIWLVPCVNGVLVSRLTMGGVATLFPMPCAVDSWLETLSLSLLDDIFAREAGRVVGLIIELDGMCSLGLGIQGRPVLEQVTKASIEKHIFEGLMKFETLTAGTSVQLLLRQLNEKVSEGNLALAKSIAAQTHGQFTPEIEVLDSVLFTILAEDIFIHLQS